ncbi:MAG: rRNA pseudouridine synthase [Alphaproteobacteria bacterium]|nr:rRNA pseudouridine synthase [Alphaproteobacteria bacterium]
MNITKRIAHSGLCSRRDAKKLVTEGDVTVNNIIIRSPTTQVNADDLIRVKNKIIKPIDDPKLWIFNKPTGFITTNNDPENRKTIFDILPKNIGRVISVGRLDINSEGLLLLTNNGDLARYLELPKNSIKRKYHVRVFGELHLTRLKNLRNGFVIDGTRYRKIDVNVLKHNNANSWLEIELEEGKNREIRKVLAHFGLKISRLKRVQYAGYDLGDVKKGETKEVTIYREIYENYLRETKGS